MDIDVKVEAARISGGAGLVTASAWTLNDWVLLATLIYMVLQCVLITPKIYAEVRNWFSKRNEDGK